MKAKEMRIHFGAMYPSERLWVIKLIAGLGFDVQHPVGSIPKRPEEWKWIITSPDDGKIYHVTSSIVVDYIPEYVISEGKLVPLPKEKSEEPTPAHHAGKTFLDELVDGSTYPSAVSDHMEGPIPTPNEDFIIGDKVLMSGGNTSHKGTIIAGPDEAGGFCIRGEDDIFYLRKSEELRLNDEYALRKDLIEVEPLPIEEAAEVLIERGWRKG